jgi:hypothetical protein
VTCRAVGLAWLGLAVGFVIVAYGIWRDRPGAVPATALIAGVSLVVCVLGLPDTVFGIPIDIAILGLGGYTVTHRRAQAG